MLILKIFFGFVLYFPIICQTRKPDGAISKENVTYEAGQKDLTVPEKWESIEKNVKNLVNKGIKMALPMLMENTGKLNLSKECVKSSLHIISGLKDLKPWAIEFLDSSGKFFDGVLTGSASSFGHYDQCLDIQVKSTKQRDKGKVLFGGQYCIINVRLPLPPRHDADKIPDMFRNISQRDTIFAKVLGFNKFLYEFLLKQGVCIPSTCSKDDLSKIVHLLGSEVYLNTSVEKCDVKEENEFTPAAIGVITIYSLIGCLVLVATLVDAYSYKSGNIFKSAAMRFLLAFSFFSNFKKFSSTDASKSNSLKCLSGVRFFAIIWIITGHAHLAMIEVNLHGVLSIKDKVENEFLYQVISNSVITVDTFFFMSGLLLSNITIKLCKHQKRRFNVVTFIIYRVLRILPAYSFVLMSCLLLHMFGSGPLWHIKSERFYRPCSEYWWTNLLFINNFYSFDNMCIPTFWYIAADFQLYVFSLVIIIPLLRRPKVGICVGVLTIIVSIIYTGIDAYIKGYPPSISFYLVDSQGLLKMLQNFHMRPFIHVGPYAIGLLAGYLLAVKPNIKISPFMQVLGWSLAFATSFALVFGTVDWYKHLEAPLVPSTIYLSIKRSFWTLALAWMIICCATGYGGIINYILSMNVFVPLGRLTFLVYLVHPIVQIVTHGSFRVRIQPSHYIYLYTALGHIFLTHAIAFVMHMLVEVPFANVVRMLTSGSGNKEGHSKPEKDKFYIEANTNQEKKEDVILNFVSDRNVNGIDSNTVGNNIYTVSSN